MTTTTHQPIDTIRDGGLNATIWKREGEKRPFYSVELSRTYKDAQGNYQDATSFSGSELLRIARLAQIAYDETLIHRFNDRRAAGNTGGNS